MMQKEVYKFLSTTFFDTMFFVAIVISALLLSIIYMVPLLMIGITKETRDEKENKPSNTSIKCKYSLRYILLTGLKIICDIVIVILYIWLFVKIIMFGYYACKYLFFSMLIYELVNSILDFGILFMFIEVCKYFSKLLKCKKYEIDQQL